MQPVILIHGINPAKPLIQIDLSLALSAPIDFGKNQGRQNMGKDERARAKREREFYRREELRRRKAKAVDAPVSGNQPNGERGRRGFVIGRAGPIYGNGCRREPNSKNFSTKNFPTIPGRLPIAAGQPDSYSP